MNNASLPVVCRSCQRTVRMEQVKFDETRKAYVCQQCWTTAHPLDSTRKQKLVDGKTAPSVKQMESAELSGKIKYSCPKCKYAFSKAKDKPVSGCPYCGYSKVEISSKGAEKILAEADEYQF